MIGVTPFVARPQDLADDDALADAIESDGRLCIAQDLPVPLDRYLRVVLDLESRPVALDAAIDVALRSSARSRGAARPDASDAERLAGAYPALRHAINDALLLDGRMVTTQEVRAIDRPEPLTGLPRDFGPRLLDGRGRYTLTRLIGAGVSGTVYAAIDRHLSEPDRPAEVAVKVLSPRRGDAMLTRRLTEEATKARRVDHPNVVRVLDRGGEQSHMPYIVYELVRGGDLQTWFEQQNKRVTVRRAAEIVAQVARGVQAAHAAGLMHSDLKPANVLLDEAGCAKVADFGIAARLQWALQESSQQAEPAGMMGNLAFIAPEQFRGEPGCFSVPADVYALGGVLFTLLTGAYPNGDSPADVAKAHGDPAGPPAQPKSARALRPEVDQSLDDVCARALAAEPRDRHTSAAELAEDLERWLSHHPITWQRPSLARVFTLWVRRRPGLVASLAVGLVVLVAGLISTGYYARENAGKAERIQSSRELISEMYSYLGKSKPDGTQYTLEDAARDAALIERAVNGKRAE